jgi:ArsR family transcriptional regulator
MEDIFVHMHIDDRHVVAPDLLFRALAETPRLRLLLLLADQGERCVGDLVSAQGEPQAKVSRHLAYLHKAGLVEVRKAGLWRFYRLALGKDPLVDGVLALVVGLAGRVEGALDDADRMKELQATGGCCPAPHTKGCA